MKRLELKRGNTNIRLIGSKIIIRAVSIAFSAIMIIALASCTGTGGPFGNNNAQASGQNQGIQTFQVVRGNILQEVTATGSVETKDQNTYSFGVSGKVMSAPEKGDEFKKGDLLVVLDNSTGLDNIDKLESDLLAYQDDIDLSKGSLNTAKINYQKALDSNHVSIQLAQLNTLKAEESIKSTFASLESANINADLAYDSAETALEKATALATQNASSTDPVTDAQNKLDSTQASGDASSAQAETNYEKAQIEASSTYWNNLSSLESAEAQIKLTKQSISDAGLKLKQAERKLESLKADVQTAKNDLEDYKIYAPYDGTVSSLTFKTGEQASQGGGSISIINTDYLLRAAVGENDIPKIKLGNETAISLDAYNNNDLTGVVEKIIPVPVVSGGIVSYDILLKFTDTKNIQIFNGLSANVSIITARAENILYVPIQSVYTENGKKYVDVMVTLQGTEKVLTNQSAQNQAQETNSQANITNNKSQQDQTQNIIKVEVTTGINDYVNIEIKSGIKEGDIIVTSKIE